MTTTIDPYGTPVTFFNKSGKTIQSVELSASAPEIVDISAPSAETFVIFKIVGFPPQDPPAGMGVRLPVCEVGSMVSISNVSTPTAVVYAPSGENIMSGSESFIANSQSASFLKCSDTFWARF